jgi:hypothetical protein
VEIPSRGIYNAYLGQVELTGKPLATFLEMSFALPANVRAAMNTSFTDLTFTIALNIPSGTTGGYLLDNLRVR